MEEAKNSLGRILVVEDDAGLNNLAQKALRKAGFEPAGVMTGAEAIERAMNDPDRKEPAGPLRGNDGIRQ